MLRAQPNHFEMSDTYHDEGLRHGKAGGQSIYFAVSRVESLAFWNTLLAWEMALL